MLERTDERCNAEMRVACDRHSGMIGCLARVDFLHMAIISGRIDLLSTPTLSCRIIVIVTEVLQMVLYCCAETAHNGFITRRLDQIRPDQTSYSSSWDQALVSANPNHTNSCSRKEARGR
jgi:hypothetical protein